LMIKKKKKIIVFLGGGGGGGGDSEFWSQFFKENLKNVPDLISASSR